MKIKNLDEILRKGVLAVSASGIIVGGYFLYSLYNQQNERDFFEVLTVKHLQAYSELISSLKEEKANFERDVDHNIYPSSFACLLDSMTIDKEELYRKKFVNTGIEKRLREKGLIK